MVMQSDFGNRTHRRTFTADRAPGTRMPWLPGVHAERQPADARCRHVVRARGSPTARHSSSRRRANCWASIKRGITGAHMQSPRRYQATSFQQKTRALALRRSKSKASLHVQMQHAAVTNGALVSGSRRPGRPVKTSAPRHMVPRSTPSAAAGAR
jgi:hypothetical protein